MTLLALLLLLGWGCASGSEWRLGRSGDSPYADSLSRGIAALDADDFADAWSPLHWLTARCEAGVYGRRAVLVLASAALDPRNPDASPDEGARLAARFLHLPGADHADRVMAETLYLLAIDRGGGIPGEAGEVEATTAPAPEATADTSSSEVDQVAQVANRFSDCDGTVSAMDPDDHMLPDLPGTPTAELFTRARSARDSLQARLAELEAELERIRELLQGGVPPDTGGLR